MTKKEKVLEENKTNDINKTDTSVSEKGIQVVDVLDTVKDNVSKTVKKAKSDNYTYLFLKAFFKRLREDKLYLLAFIITIAFLGIFSVAKLKDTDGYYDRREQGTLKDKDNKEDNKPVEEPPVISDDIDVSSYVGIYSREVQLTTPLQLSDTCEINSYKFVYEIKSDKTITKYLVNECLGTLNIWSDKLAYVSSGGARYISANSINYLFAASSIKEVDGETYKVDDTINSLKVEDKLKNTEIYFYSNNFILQTMNDLILIKGSSIGFQLSEDHNIVNDILEKTVYKSNTDDTFKFIEYTDTDSKSCYTDTNIEEKELYKIYSIKYNEDKSSFNKPKEIVTRSNKDGCDILNQDVITMAQ